GAAQAANAAAPPTGTAESSLASATPGAIAGSIDAGQQHSCGVQTDGTLLCWGDDSSGQASPPGGTYTAAAAGDAHSCAIKTNGRPARWGDASAGQANPAGRRC